MRSSSSSSSSMLCICVIPALAASNLLPRDGVAAALVGAFPCCLIGVRRELDLERRLVGESDGIDRRADGEVK